MVVSSPSVLCTHEHASSVTVALMDNVNLC